MHRTTPRQGGAAGLHHGDPYGDGRGRRRRVSLARSIDRSKAAAAMLLRRAPHAHTHARMTCTPHIPHVYTSIHHSKGKAPAAAAAGKTPTVQPGAHPDQLSGAPWVEKFRPAGLGDLVAHEEIISIRTWLADWFGVAREGSVKGLHIHTYTYLPIYTQCMQSTGSSTPTSCRTSSSTGPPARARPPPSSPAPSTLLD